MGLRTVAQRVPRKHGTYPDMKGRSCHNTGTPDISGIAGYFRLMENNMHYK